jgi:putative membrane protein
MNIPQTIPVADTWGMHGGLGAGWWTGMVIMMVLFWGVIIIGAGWLIRGGSNRGPWGFDCWPWMGRQTEPPTETPTDVLERRFAQGAISVEDYQARRKVLADGVTRPDRAPKDEALTAPGGREGSQR